MMFLVFHSLNWQFLAKKTELWTYFPKIANSKRHLINIVQSDITKIRDKNLYLRHESINIIIRQYKKIIYHHHHHYI